MFRANRTAITVSNVIIAVVVQSAPKKLCGCIEVGLLVGVDGMLVGFCVGFSGVGVAVGFTVGLSVILERSACGMGLSGSGAVGSGEVRIGV